VAVQVLCLTASAGSAQRVSEVAAGRPDLDRCAGHWRNARDGHRLAHARPRRGHDLRTAQPDDQHRDSAGRIAAPDGGLSAPAVSTCPQPPGQDAPASTPGTLGALLMRYPSQTCVRLAPQRRNSLTATLVRDWQTTLTTIRRASFQNCERAARFSPREFGRVGRTMSNYSSGRIDMHISGTLISACMSASQSCRPACRIRQVERICGAP